MIVLTADTSTGVRMAAERVAAAFLRNVDSHSWRQFDLPRPRWVCADCWLPLESVAGARCTGGPPM